MLEHVELVAGSPEALRVIDVKSAVADDARERRALPGGEVETVAPDGLPGEIAADAEPADVAAQEELMAGRHRIAQARPDDRVEPVDRAGAGDRTAALEAQVADIDGPDEG